MTFTDMTIDQFVAFMVRHLDLFASAWKAAASVQGREVYPESMSLAEWAEQLTSFAEQER